MSPGVEPPLWASATQRAVAGVAIERLEAGEREIEGANLAEWKSIRQRFLTALEAGFPGEYSPTKPLDPTTLDARVVSRHTFGPLEIENVLFRSAVGWQINATVFRPTGGGRLPGVVCPTGSSTKLNYPYWSSAGLIARSGYVVLSYDPHGYAGERREGSDMFRYAPLGYLTGLLPPFFFVADTTAAIDYLATRSDVDPSAGFAVTGLSLGAQTTVNASIHDPRVRFIAPVCGIASYFDHLLPELYTVHCGEMIPDIIAAGMDFGRRLSLFAPRRSLLVCGAGDEIVTPEHTRSVYEKAKAIYRLYGADEELELFIDEESDHTFSPAMVNEVVTRLDETLKGVPRASGSRYAYTAMDVIEIPREAMMSHPDTSQNVCSLNAGRARALAASRTTRKEVEVAARLAKLLRLDRSPHEVSEVSHRIVAPPVRSWVHDFTRLSIDVDDRELPGLLIARAGASGAPGLLFIDESGIWAGIRGHGYLAKAFRFLDRSLDANEPAVLAIDASGFGTLAHRESAYDATSWSDPDSTLAYLGIAAGVPVAGMRVRDALAALDLLEHRAEVDPSRLMIAGLGEGAITALFAAVIHGGCARTILVDPPLSFTAIVEAGDHAWLRSSFVPELLVHFDLPDLALSTGGEVRIVRPLDAARMPVSPEAAVAAYPRAHVATNPLLAERNRDFVEAALAPLG